MLELKIGQTASFASVFSIILQFKAMFVQHEQHSLAVLCHEDGVWSLWGWRCILIYPLDDFQRGRLCPWIRRLVTSLSPRGPRFSSGPVHLRFMVNRAEVGQDILRVPWFWPEVLFHHSSILTFIHMFLGGSLGNLPHYPPPPHTPKHTKQCFFFNRGALARKIFSLFRQRGDPFSLHAMLQYNQDSACPQTQNIRSSAPAGFRHPDRHTDWLTVSHKLTWTSGLK